MLTFLKVKDFAIIEELGIELQEGLNVITGETGAGKSIIINALSVLMNAKASTDLIRTGTSQAEVSGHFFYGDEEYVVKRIISLAGRSRAFLNDDPVTLGRLEDTGKKLINIYGQNEFHHLLNRENYIRIIDTLLDLTGDRELLAVNVAALRRVKGELESRKREAAGKEKETWLLEFQIDEIEKSALREGEEEEIREKLKILKDAERIRSSLDSITENLYSGDRSMYGVLGSIAGSLKPFLAIEAIEKLKNRIESLSFEVEDIMMDVKGVEKTTSFDPGELGTLEERLSHIFQMKSKYGPSVSEIRAFEESARKRLAYLADLSEDIAVLEREKSLLDEAVTGMARVLSARRREGVPPVEKAIMEEFELLSMKGTLFTIAVTEKGNIDEEGADEIELLISTNPGEPLKPLRKIASGGELSRIMLAMKRVISGEEKKVLVFDEVDAGIGGAVADMVGRRLKRLAKEHQVICITHLPQIAVYGDSHYIVEKNQREEGTRTGIRRLSKEERILEVARMMGGASITEKALQRAEEMLHNVEKGID